LLQGVYYQRCHDPDCRCGSLPLTLTIP
jgi:hypothetical protein